VTADATRQAGLKIVGLFPVIGWEHEAAEHRAVLRAAEERDAERAAGLLRDHITSFLTRNFPEPQENQST
jgi:DNA-binding GntR family transcriptional regulator